MGAATNGFYIPGVSPKQFLPGQEVGSSCVIGFVFSRAVP